jgi:hypothetical protein
MDFFNDSPRTALAALLLLAFVVYIAYGYLSDPLRAIPGPLITRFTRLWEVHAVSKNNFQAIEVSLHKKYGTILPLPSLSHSSLL